MLHLTAEWSLARERASAERSGTRRAAAPHREDACLTTRAAQWLAKSPSSEVISACTGGCISQRGEREHGVEHRAAAPHHEHACLTTRAAQWLAKSPSSEVISACAGGVFRKAQQKL